MNDLSAEFSKQYLKGPQIQGRLHLPGDAFSVCVLFGPSGSGKTTLLRCLAGLERPDAGFIRFGAGDWFDASKKVLIPPHRRPIGYLSQDYSLFPHLSVVNNIGYGLATLSAVQRGQRVNELVQLFALESLRERYPRQLSGGQQQRVALARAVARCPRLLLLDEPLSALDAPTRETLRRQLRQWLTRLNVPCVIVTHDRTEALTLGDSVCVMNEGRVCQFGAVDEVFSRPGSLEVARIVGVETVVGGEVVRVENGLVEVALGNLRLYAVDRGGVTARVFVSIRGEDVVLMRDKAPSSARNHLVGVVRRLERKGPGVRVLLDCGFPLTVLVTLQSSQELELTPGRTVCAVVKAPAVHLIPRS